MNDGQRLSRVRGFVVLSGLLLFWAGSPGTAQAQKPSDEAQKATSVVFAGFTYNQVLQHFRYYHERSECVYEGGGAWANLEYNLAHPLVRDSSRRAQGYMRAASVETDPLYSQRARAALDWLLADQKPDGHFTWWNTPSGTDNTFDCQYTTGEGGSALAEGYAFFNDPRYLQASAKAAQWEENLELVWNTNYVMFTVWHLAKHYRITGDQRWLNAAVFKVVNCAFPRQDTDGGWKEGSGAPADVIGHNKRIWYHAIILRALIELYRVLPADHAIRTQLRNSIQAGVNRAFDMQMDSGEISVGAGVPNEHRNAFILEALLMAHEYAGMDTLNAIRGVMKYRMDFSKPPYQVVGFNIDVQSVGNLMKRFSAVIPNPPAEPPDPPIPAVPAVENPGFENDGGPFTLAKGWQTFGFGKREGFLEAGHAWVQGMADYPEGKSMGVYQFIGGVEPGAGYRVSVDTRVSSTQLAASLGVAGVKSHDYHQALFSSEHRGTGWTTLTVNVTPSEPWLTVFLRGRNTDTFRISFDRALFDNVKLERIGPTPPAILLAPTTLTATAVKGAVPPSTSFTVRNAGGGTLEYTVTDNADWLSTSPTAGTSTGEADTITVTYATSSLNAGTYHATISVSSPGASNSPQSISVTLTITPGGEPGPNLLVNGNFEGGFYNDPDVDRKSGNGWKRFVESGVSKSGGYFGTYVSASWSQYINESSWIAGVYQQVTINAGQQLRGRVYIRGTDTTVKFKIGIDPTGGTNPTAPGVVWSNEAAPGATWQAISSEAVSAGTQATLFLRAQNTSPANRYAWFDDAELRSLGGVVTHSPADHDTDGDVDQEDFGWFQACFTGPNIPQDDPGCAKARLDGDADVDQDDFAIFQGCLSGANIPANPACAQ